MEAEETFQRVMDGPGVKDTRRGPLSPQGHIDDLWRGGGLRLSPDEDLGMLRLPP
jgi:hypothetical protein